MRLYSRIVLLVAGLALNTVACAAESSFAYSYTSETLPKGGNEFAFWVTHRWDKTIGSYRANDLVLEYERGLTDRLTGALYVEGFDLKAHDAFPLAPDGSEVYAEDIDVTKVSAYKASLKYNFLSPYKDAIGLAFVWEGYYRTWYPKVDGARTEQWSFEPKVVVQKNFLDDQLVSVLNLAVEAEHRRFPDAGTSENEFALTYSGGLSYRFASNLFAGLEAVRRSDILNGQYNHYSFFLGPTITYGSEGWYVSATYLRQLMGDPTYSHAAYPDGFDPVSARGYDSDLHLEEDVVNELRVRVGFNF